MAPKTTSSALTPDSGPNSKTSSPDFTTYFEEVTDPRIERRKEHTLLDIIGLTICAVVAGADTFTGIERFGEAREEWLRPLYVTKMRRISTRERDRRPAVQIVTTKSRSLP
ncbi:transposase family protein, partial [Salinibacter ruber]